MNLSLSTSPPTKLVSVQVKCQSKGDDEGTDGKGEQEKRGEGGGSTSVTRRKRMMDEFVICRLNKYVPGTLNWDSTQLNSSTAPRYRPAARANEVISATPPHATGRGGSNKLPLPAWLAPQKRKANKAFSIDHKYEAHLLLSSPLSCSPYLPPSPFKPHNKNFSNYSTRGEARGGGAWAWLPSSRICDSTRCR